MLIAGFETFNLGTYKEAAARAATNSIRLTVLTDTQLQARSPVVSEALVDADVVFCSLIFDYDQVEWLRAQLSPAGYVFVFESALELMSCTRVNSFSMDTGSEKRGMPPAIKFVLNKLGLAGREEDKLAGYLTLLKNAPRFLKLVPGKGARDVRHWMTVYSYWNAGGTENVVAMMEYIVSDVLDRPAIIPNRIPDVVQIPNVGLVHPAYDGIFEHPAEYIEWYERRFPYRKTWPRVAILLYRKHVVSRLKYIPQLLESFESAQIIPVPVFITGVEAHIVVRDYLSSVDKEAARARGDRLYGSFREGKIAHIDAVVSTIGYVSKKFLSTLQARVSEHRTDFSYLSFHVTLDFRWLAAPLVLWQELETRISVKSF